MVVGVRSPLLSAGLAAAVLAAGAGVAVVSPVATAPLPVTASPTVQLSALAISLPKPTKPLTNPFGGNTGATPGERIINGYNAIQPWAQYGVELSAWTVGWAPWPIGLIAPQMNIGYSAVEPLSRATVYSVAYAVDGQFDLIQPTIKNGIQTSVNNLVQGELGWIASFFPPLPPIRGAAAVKLPKAPVRAAATTAAAAPKRAAAAVVPRVKPAAATAVSKPAAAVQAPATEARKSPAPRTHKGTRSAAKRAPGAAGSEKSGRSGR